MKRKAAFADKFCFFDQDGKVGFGSGWTVRGAGFATDTRREDLSQRFRFFYFACKVCRDESHSPARDMGFVQDFRVDRTDCLTCAATDTSL